MVDWGGMGLGRPCVLFGCSVRLQHGGESDPHASAPSGGPAATMLAPMHAVLPPRPHPAPRPSPRPRLVVVAGEARSASRARWSAATPPDGGPTVGAGAALIAGPKPGIALESPQEVVRAAHWGV